MNWIRFEHLLNILFGPSKKKNEEENRQKAWAFYSNMIKCIWKSLKYWLNECTLNAWILKRRRKKKSPFFIKKNWISISRDYSNMKRKTHFSHLYIDNIFLENIERFISMIFILNVINLILKNLCELFFFISMWFCIGNLLLVILQYFSRNRKFYDWIKLKKNKKI